MRNESTYILSYNDIQYDEFIYIYGFLLIQKCWWNQQNIACDGTQIIENHRMIMIII